MKQKKIINLKAIQQYCSSIYNELNKYEGIRIYEPLQNPLRYIYILYRIKTFTPLLHDLRYYESNRSGNKPKDKMGQAPKVILSPLGLQTVYSNRQGMLTSNNQVLPVQYSPMTLLQTSQQQYPQQQQQEQTLGGVQQESQWGQQPQQQDSTQTLSQTPQQLGSNSMQQLQIQPMQTQSQQQQSYYSQGNNGFQPNQFRPQIVPVMGSSSLPVNLQPLRFHNMAVAADTIKS
jgi:hypothetical protein